MWTFGILAFVCVHISLANVTDIIVETACHNDQLPCDSGGCISKGLWCDSTVDCGDGSDEYYCGTHGRTCQPHHFKCGDRSCIPLGALCDGVPDCKDGSDETKCERKTKNQNIRSYFNQNRHIQSIDVIPQENWQLLQRSQRWLLAQRTEDYGWGENSARAMVALALANLQSNGLDENLMVKQLNIQIVTDILRNDLIKISPTKLALNINALLATCQNPRNFQGLNLVKDLRLQADLSIESNKLVSPLILLTLCLVNETKYLDIENLNRTFEQERTRKIDLQALTLISMQCIANQRNRHDQSSSIVQNTQLAAKRLMTKYTSNRNPTDVYTIALVIQSMNLILHPTEWNKPFEIKKLLSHQQDDGSFGDFLSTYYAILALARNNYLSLKNMNCSGTTTTNVEPMELPPYQGDQITVRYSLWFGSPVVDIHTLSLKVASNWNFFEIMKFAATQNNLFGFKHEQLPDGPQVFSIAGIPNDAEREFYWAPYKQNADVGIQESSATPFSLMDRPFDGNHVVFWFKHKNYNLN